MQEQKSAQEFKAGGLVLFACFVGVATGLASLSYYTAGIFMTSFEQEFGWSRAQISAQSLLGVGAIAIFAPFVGMLVDRFGTRYVSTISLFFYALSFFLLSKFTTSLTSFYLISLAAAVLAIGTTPITFTHAITGWFNKARGLALGMALVGTGVTGILAPLFLTPYVDENGWRSGLQVLGVIVFIAAIFVGIFLKDAPKLEDVSGPIENAEAEKTTTLSQTRSTRSVFILLAFIFFLVAIAVSGLIVHFIPMLKDAGVAPAKAGQFAAVIGLSIICGRIVTGFLIDRFFAPRVAAILFGLSALGYAVFAFGGPNFAIFAAIAVGLSMGAEVDLIAFLTSRYFKLSSYGKIYGSLYVVFVVGAAISPVAMGCVFDRFGAYDLAIIVSVLCLAASAFLSLLLPKYRI